MGVVATVIINGAALRRVLWAELRAPMGIVPVGATVVAVALTPSPPDSQQIPENLHLAISAAVAASISVLFALMNAVMVRPVDCHQK